MRKYIGFIILVVGILKVEAQNTVYINGVNVYNYNSLFHVNGDVMITSGGVLNNEGTLYVRNALNNGDFHINAASTSQGNGNYHIEHDWINDGTFNAGTSLVTLDGANQLITGSQVTTFHNLTLTGSGVKTQTIDANIDATGVLNLTTVELATGNNTMHVLNPSNNAVVTNSPTSTSTGFVSSTGNGALEWITGSTQDYLFPVGSSVVPARYRPVIITPNASGATTYSVRFVNNDPNLDGFNRSVHDGSICNADSLFYHDIERVNGTTAADIAVLYVSGTDGNWDGLAHWRTTNNMWNDMGTVGTFTIGSFNVIRRNAWLFANPGFPYVLVEKAPAAPLVTGDSVLCVGETSATFIASGGSGTYSWAFPSGVTVVSANNDSSQVTVSWSGGAGSVIVIAQSSSGSCASAPAIFNVGVFPPPTAYGYADTNNVYAGIPIQFIDTSAGGVVAWSWNFGDGYTSSYQNTWHEFNGTGTYPVILTVTDTNGCTDTAMIYVTIVEGIIIPNVFSPNGDGVNDVFKVVGGGFSEFNLKIYNRWGEQLFESSNVDTGWDGRTSAGLPASPGTYYFILTAKTASKDYSTTGFLTLLR